MQWQIQGRGLGARGPVPLLFLDKTEARIPWVPEAFHGRFPVSVKSEKVTRSFLRPLAEHLPACSRRNEAPRRTQKKKNTGTQGKARRAEKPFFGSQMKRSNVKNTVVQVFFSPPNSLFCFVNFDFLLTIKITCNLNATCPKQSGYFLEEIRKITLSPS